MIIESKSGKDDIMNKVANVLNSVLIVLIVINGIINSCYGFILDSTLMRILFLGLAILDFAIVALYFNLKNKI